MISSNPTLFLYPKEMKAGSVTEQPHAFIVLIADATWSAASTPVTLTSRHDGMRLWTTRYSVTTNYKPLLQEKEEEEKKEEEEEKYLYALPPSIKGSVFKIN